MIRIDESQPSQVYEITFKADGRKYIGITWGKKMSYLRRYKIHLSGKGSKVIKKLIEDGYTETDFSISLLYNNIPFYEAKKLENELSILYPEGLNGNKANAIIQTEEGHSKWLKKMRQYWDNKPKSDPQKHREYLKNLKKNDPIAYNEYIKNVGKRKDETKRKISESNKGKSRPHTDEERKNISKSMKEYLSSMTKEEKIERMKKSALNLTLEQKIERGKKISNSKKGKKTNQRDITKQRYKNMTDNDFYDMISVWTKGCQTRAITIRNEE